MVQAHNSNPSASFKMDLNRFADWTSDEIKAVMFPSKPKTHESWGKYELPYEPLVDTSSIPRTLDWRDTAIGGIVKDQSLCGSCWAFAATGAMESAWNKANGSKSPSILSDQQVTDCSWNWGSHACEGGEPYAGIAAAIEAGGISTAKEYEYIGQDDFCRAKNVTKLANFSGYARIPSYDDSALMEAVYSRGAIAVSLDASPSGFLFYSSGVFSDPSCKTAKDELDHAVLVVGYGTDEETGRDYWLIKNSWSTHWGDEGYIKIDRGLRACGVTADAVYAVV